MITNVLPALSGRDFLRLLFTLSLAGFVALFITAHQALAQTSVPATAPVSLVPFWASVTPYIVGLVSAFVLWVTPKLNAWLVQHRLSAVQDDFDQALQHVPGLITTMLSSVASHNQAMALPVAVSNVAKIIMQVVPGLAGQLKFAPETVESYVIAKLNAVGHPAVTTAPAAKV